MAPPGADPALPERVPGLRSGGPPRRWNRQAHGVRAGACAAAVVGLIAGALGGCGSPGGGGATGTLVLQPDDPVVDTAAVAVFRAAYAAVADRSLEPLPVAEIARRSLAGLATLDPAIGITASEEAIGLTEGGRRVGSLPAPAGADPDGWAVATAALWQGARRSSRMVRERPAEDVYSAMLGGLAATLDRFSAYASAADARLARERRDGHPDFGFTLARGGDGRLAVADVLPGGPAERAGIRTGDIVHRLDGVPAVHLDQSAIAVRLAAGRSDRLLLIVQRPGRAPRAFRLQRMTIVPDTVSESIEGGLVTYRVDHFNQGTVAALATRLATLARRTPQPPAGLILDLRGNSGGILHAAVKVADLFLPTGPVAETRGRHPESRQRFIAGGGDVAFGLPIVVLVDGRTASAAEVLAAALKDRGRAVVVGSATYGKGRVQTVVPLPNQGELTLTWARLISPGGRELDGAGVEPSVCTAATAGAAAPLTAGRPAAGCPRRPGTAADIETARVLFASPALYARALAPTPVAAPDEPAGNGGRR